MATDRMAYDTLQTTMARQRVTVYDLYGLLDVSPNASDAAIREAYEALLKNLQPNVPSNVVSLGFIKSSPHHPSQNHPKFISSRSLTLDEFIHRSMSPTAF